MSDDEYVRHGGRAMITFLFAFSELPESAEEKVLHARVARGADPPYAPVLILTACHPSLHGGEQKLGLSLDEATSLHRYISDRMGRFSDKAKDAYAVVLRAIEIGIGIMETEETGTN